jgi:adenylate cyclase class 1
LNATWYQQRLLPCEPTFLKDKIDRYRIYNRSRKIKAISFNESKATLLFKIVPFLLHSNYPSLPGFVDSPKCPYGIHKFDPEQIVSPTLFKRYFPTSSAFKNNTPSPYTAQPCIYSLNTIGSIGTIAQTEKSDCDYWVSIRHDELDPKGLSMLEQKCDAIEEWALKRGTEIHFFLMDIDQTRENLIDSKAEKESAGSALKLLLKDELFRTHILVAGKMLLWWLTPPGLTEEGYRDFIKKLVANNEINPDNFIDLGYIADLPKEEIFGASLWQMNKALDSPFKSVIKFAYLEQLYRDKRQALPLFSDKVKCLVTFPEHLTQKEQEELELTNVDPYLLLAREIVAFYQNQEPDQQRADLIRKCLFLKTLDGMESQKKIKSSSSNIKITIELMQRWRLLPENSDHLLKLNSWTPNEMVELGTKVHDYLIETYNRLSKLFKTFKSGTGLTITQRDISVLGRKLFTFYQKKPHKVEYIRSLSRDAMAQENITFHYTRNQNIHTYYALLGKHDYPPAGSDSNLLIKKNSDPLELITWLLVNGILAEKTKLHLTKHFHPFALSDLQDLTSTMLKKFPCVNFASISAQPLTQKEVVVRALAVVNLTKNPVRGADSLQSSIISINSYGEYFIHNYNTLKSLKKALHDLLTKHYVSRWNNNLEIFIPPQPDQHYIQSLIYK